MRTTRLIRNLLIALVIALLGGLLAWRTGEALRARRVQDQAAGQPRNNMGVPVQTVPAARKTLISRAAYTGEVVARSSVQVFARISGIIADLPVPEGAAVARGQIVARLDPKELRFRVEQAAAQVRSQRLAVEQSSAALQTQRARLAQVLAGSPDEQVRQAEAEVRQARANLEFSRAQLRRMEDLYGQGFVPAQQVEAARLDVTVQESRLRSAEEALALVRQGSRPEEIEVARAQLRQAEVALRQAQSALAQSQVSLREAQSELGESVVRAPAAGVVVRRLVELGTTITPSTALMEVVDIDPVIIAVAVSERQVAQLRPGMPVVVRADAFPGRTFAGRVSAVSPVLATETRTAEIKIAVANPRGQLRPGMFARVEMVLARREQAVAVPVDAVVEREEEPVVFVVQDGRAHQRRVRPGISDGTDVEILSGVQAGEPVIIAGQSTLRDGAPVIAPGQRGPGQGVSQSPGPGPTGPGRRRGPPGQPRPSPSPGGTP